MKKPLGRRDMRKFDRRHAELPVTVSTRTGGRTKAGITLDAADVSEGGAFLRSDLLFEVGEVLSLEIPLPTGTTLKAEGRVARVSRAAAGRGGMGIEFIDLPLGDRRSLSSTLAKLGAGAALHKNQERNQERPSRPGKVRPPA